MKRIFGVSALVLAMAFFAGTVLAQSHMDTQDEPPPGGGYYAYATEWVGGTNTLPYGKDNAAAVKQHALTMPTTQQGITLMLENGFVRRADLDIAVTRLGYSIAVLGFEKVGTPVSGPAAKEPVLCVVTSAYEVPGIGFMPSTQVTGFVVRDSSGQPVPSLHPDDTGDTFVLVGMLPQSQDLVMAKIDSARAANGLVVNRGLGPEDVFLERGVSIWDMPGGPGMLVTWSPAYNPQVAACHNNAFAHGATQGAIWGAGAWASGMVASPQYSPQLAAIGFATGFVSGYMGAWMSTPPSHWRR